MNFIYLRSNIFDYDYQKLYRSKTLQENFKGVVFDYRMEILVWNDRQKDDAKLSICKESFLPVRGVFFTRKDFYALHDFNKKIDFLKNSGWTQHIIDQKLRLKKIKPSKPGPTALKFHDLQGVFEIVFYCSLVAIVVFLLEVLSTISWDKNKA